MDFLVNSEIEDNALGRKLSNSACLGENASIAIAVNILNVIQIVWLLHSYDQGTSMKTSQVLIYLLFIC